MDFLISIHIFSLAWAKCYGMNYCRVWVKNHIRERSIDQQEARKITVLMLKIVKWEEEVVPIGPTFEGDPTGFKPSASPSAVKPAIHSRIAHILVIIESMFKMLLLDHIIL